MARTTKILVLGCLMGAFGTVGTASAESGADAARAKLNAHFSKMRKKTAALPSRKAGGPAVVLASRSKLSSQAPNREEQMDRLVRDNKGQVRYCHHRAESFSRRKAPASVSVGLQIAKTGEVKSVGFASKSPSRLEQCLATRIKGWQFPSASADSQLSYLFVFSGTR